MTLTLELTPEQERRLQAEAARSGLPLPEYALRRLLGDAQEEAEREDALKRRLLASGLYVELAPRSVPNVPTSRFKTRPVQGKPISQTIIEERR